MEIKCNNLYKIEHEINWVDTDHYSTSFLIPWQFRIIQYDHYILLLPKLDINICVNNVWAQIDLYGAMVGPMAGCAEVTMINGDTGVYDVRSHIWVIDGSFYNFSLIHSHKLFHLSTSDE